MRHNASAVAVTPVTSIVAVGKGCDCVGCQQVDPENQACDGGRHMRRTHLEQGLDDNPHMDGDATVPRAELTAIQIVDHLLAVHIDAAETATAFVELLTHPTDNFGIRT
eukprot:SAG25_NODE_10696_length_325_cov_0.845133_1_plen_108_part_11